MVTRHPVTPAGAPVVTVTRQRDPLSGQRLPVLGRLRRHGSAELLVVLADGSKRLIPAAWTDADASAAGDASAIAGTLGPAGELLRLSELISALAAQAERGREQAARKSPGKEDNHAACPAQSAAGPGSGATTRGRRAGAATAAAGSAGPSGRADRQGGTGERGPR
jgi:Family of unknown function (DUF5372)